MAAANLGPPAARRGGRIDPAQVVTVLKRAQVEEIAALAAARTGETTREPVGETGRVFARDEAADRDETVE
ncbi:hypothetical protein [Roseovarius sp. C03]|uniref:hypothetical protein n=1 Tax=Roseovarius sp. C03 TaxID=3449222 RepID=UPI003EDC3810